MKNIKNILRICILFSLYFSFSFYSLFAGDIKIRQGDPELKISQNTYTTLHLTNSFTMLNYRAVKTENGVFTELSASDYGYSNRLGDPKLPVCRKMIEVPFGATIKVNVINYTMTEYKLSDYGIKDKIIPVQPSVSKDQKQKLPPFEYNINIYNADVFNSDDLVSAAILGEMRGVRLARLDIAPVRYNPVTNTIRVYNDIEVEITFPGANVAQTIEMKENKSSIYFESMFKNQLLNYKKLQGTKDTITKYPVKYVIVSDPSFKTALQPFIHWKTKKGFTVVEAYTNDVNVGNTTASIKSYLTNLYNSGTLADPAPTFVLFVGDVTQIPTFTGNTGAHPTDLYYCEYTGDYFPEVYYGRFSANDSSQLQPQIDKTLEYEQYLMPDPSFLRNVVMTAGQDPTYGPLYGDGQINYGTSTYFNTAHGLNSFTYLFAISGISSANIIQNVSEGVSYANYTAHGSSYGWVNPPFSISDIAGLQNAHKYPLMVGNCCQTNTFSVDCFGVELLRASNKGALGYIGAADLSYWDEDYWWAVGYKSVTVHPTYNSNCLGSYDRTFHDHGEPFGEWYASQGQMVFAGNLAVTQSGSSNCEYYWEIYCLMGDPSLMIYYGVPPQITASYIPVIPLNWPSFIVNTEPYAYVGVSRGDTLYGAAMADSLGVATVPVLFTTPGPADVVVTKQNRAPFISTVPVNNPSGPFIFYDSKQIHDTGGNNNGQVDFGETITLDITLKNVGASVANNVTAKLRTNDTLVTLIDSTQSWGNINSNITSTQTDAYSFSVANIIPDQHVVPFTVYITDNNGNSWTGAFTVVINAPVMKIGNITIDDANGNGNGRLDPGENVNIIIHSSNIGHSDAINSISDISNPSGNITVNSSTDNLGTLAALTGSGYASFNITVSPTATIGSFVTFTNTLTSGLFSAQKPISLMIGLVDEDWETGNFNKFQWAQGKYPWMITNQSPFEGVYSAMSDTATTDLDTSSLWITLNVLSPDTISFYEKVSSEESYDFLKFYIDSIETGAWSGTGGSWQRAAFPVTAGLHTFTWSYEKDISVSEGSDCGWIDYILFPPIQLNGVSVSEFNNKPNDMVCYPNPFNRTTAVRYNIGTAGKVSLKVYNIMGQEVATLVDNNQQAGSYSLSFNAENLSSGIYQCVLSAADNLIVKKLMISK